MKHKYILFGIIFLLSVSFSSAVQIDDCGFLNSASTTYDLNKSVSVNGETCFTVNSTNIILDCNGFSITGNNSLAAYGVRVNVATPIIKNCNISGFGIGVGNSASSFAAHYYNNTIYANVSSSYYAIRHRAIANIEIINNTIITRNGAIAIGFNSAGSTANNVSVKNNYIECYGSGAYCINYGNPGGGLNASDNIFMLSSSAGIDSSTSSNNFNNVLYNNKFYGNGTAFITRGQWNIYNNTFDGIMIWNIGNSNANGVNASIYNNNFTTRRFGISSYAITTSSNRGTGILGHYANVYNNIFTTYGNSSTTVYFLDFATGSNIGNGTIIFNNNTFIVYNLTTFINQRAGVTNVEYQGITFINNNVNATSVTNFFVLPNITGFQSVNNTIISNSKYVISTIGTKNAIFNDQYVGLNMGTIDSSNNMNFSGGIYNLSDRGFTFLLNNGNINLNDLSLFSSSYVLGVYIRNMTLNILNSFFYADIPDTLIINQSIINISNTIINNYNQTYTYGSTRYFHNTTRGKW